PPRSVARLTESATHWPESATPHTHPHHFPPTSSTHPRAPPPFPTRRSSDLRPAARPAVSRPPTTPRRPAPAARPSMGIPGNRAVDRKSTRVKSSHVAMSYGVFCLKKKSGSPDSAARSAHLRRSLVPRFG